MPARVESSFEFVACTLRLDMCHSVSSMVCSVPPEDHHRTATCHEGENFSLSPEEREERGSILRSAEFVWIFFSPRLD